MHRGHGHGDRFLLSLALLAFGACGAAPSPTGRAGARYEEACRFWVMERQILSDFEGMGQGSLGRRAHFAWAVGLDVHTTDSAVREAGNSLGADARADARGRELARLVAENQDIAALAAVLGDLARMGEVLRGQEVRLLTTGTLPPGDLRELDSLTRDAETWQASLGEAQDTGLARAERADLAVEARGLHMLAHDTLTPGRALVLAALARERTQEMGAQIDPFRARMRRQVRTAVRGLVLPAGPSEGRNGSSREAANPVATS